MKPELGKQYWVQFGGTAYTAKCVLVLEESGCYVFDQVLDIKNCIRKEHSILGPVEEPKPEHAPSYIEFRQRNMELRLRKRLTWALIWSLVLLTCTALGWWRLSVKYEQLQKEYERIANQ